MTKRSEQRPVGVSGLPVDWRLLSLTAESAGLAWLIWNAATGEFWCIDPRGVLGPGDAIAEGADLAAWLADIGTEASSAVARSLLVEVGHRQDIATELSLGGTRLELLGTLFRDASGTPYGSALIRDVTEVRAAEAQLVADAERFKNIFETAPVPMALENASHVLVDVNEAFERLTGYGRDALIRRSAASLGFWSSAAEQGAILEYLDAGARGVLPLSLRTAAARVKQVLASITPGQVNGSPGYVLLLSDVTEHNVTRRRLMEALQGAMREDTGLGESFMDKLAELEGEREAAGLAELTPRERDVLTRLAEGKWTQAIADDLGLTPSTVRNYVSSTYQKLGVSSRGQAIIWAREHGLGGE